MNRTQPSCGILGTGLYLPGQVRTCQDIAQLSGIPEWVIRDKFGINQVYVPSETDQTSDMAVWAAEDCLQKTGIDPEDIDLVIYFGENYSDYQLFSVAPKVIGAIGAVRAWGYDMECKCGSFVVALDQAKKYLRCEPDMDTVLLVAGYRNVDKADYSDPSVSFLYDLSCAGAAALVKKDQTRGLVLENANLADGRFAESIMVPGGGSKHPLTPDNVADPYWHYFRLQNPEHFREQLGAVTINNLVTVTREACRKSGLRVEDIDFACPLHMKVSAHRQLLNDLGIPLEKSLYLSDNGHSGQLDGIIALHLAAEQQRISEGDIVAVIAMGFGYQWNAGIIRW